MTAMKQLFRQGDILLERVADSDSAIIDDVRYGAARVMASALDPDGSIVLARGEATGHRHRFFPSSSIAMFRDDGLARDIPSELYVGHIKITAKGGAALRHEEHDTINLPVGTYRVRRQREHDAGAIRIVAD